MNIIKYINIVIITSMYVMLLTSEWSKFKKKMSVQTVKNDQALIFRLALKRTLEDFLLKYS